ncbi:hypothetical protein C8Q77DRAFT_1158546 [Trametes polyzona]|nr:hypothetical protein C8Q77DRAFT_1158546 [Trametes polyzona]
MNTTSVVPGPQSPSPSPSTPSSKPPTLDSTFGSFLLGIYIALMLYGISIHQLYRYLLRYYHQDGYTVKAFVIVTFFLETLLTIVSLHACYHYLVANSFKPNSLIQGVWSFDAISLLSGLVISIAQCFFARRVYKLRPKLYPLAAISVLFSFAAFALATTASVRNSTASSLINPESYVLPDALGMGAAVVSDTLTTSVLIVVLRKSRTGLRQTDLVLERLILYTINTGLLTVIFDVLSVSFYLTPYQGIAYPNDLIDFSIGLVGTKGKLNARESLSEDMSMHRDGAISLGPLGISLPSIEPDHAGSQPALALKSDRSGSRAVFA